jgi:hypothetical protein
VEARVSVWATVAAVGAGTIGLKAVGPVLLGGRPLPPGIAGVVELLAPALGLVSKALRRLHALEGPAPVNAWLHDHGHWHIEVLPRLTVFAGIELGAGIYVNSLAPETAAAALREAR